MNDSDNIIRTIEQLAEEIASDSLPSEMEPFTEWSNSALHRRIRSVARIALFKLLAKQEQIAAIYQQLRDPIFLRGIGEGEFEE